MIIGVVQFSKEYTIKTYLTKRVWRIFPPFAFWTLVSVLIYTFVLGMYPADISTVFSKIIRGFRAGVDYHMWFIYVLIGVYLFMPIIGKWIRASTRSEIRFFLIIWLMSMLYRIGALHSVLPKVDLINFSGYLGYVVLGYYLSQIEMKKKLWPIVFIVIGTSVTFGGTYFYSMKGHRLDEFFYDYLTLNVCIQAIGYFLLIKQMEIRNVLLNEIITFVSKHSFGIYLSHLLVLRCLDAIGVNFDFTSPIVSIFLTSTCCLMVSSVLVYFIRKIKFGGLIAG